MSLRVMDEVQGSWEHGCCIPGCIPAGTHTSPVCSVDKDNCSISGEENIQSNGSQLQGDSFLRHSGQGVPGTEPGTVTQGCSAPAAGAERVVEGAAENRRSLLGRNAKVSLLPCSWGGT